MNESIVTVQWSDVDVNGHMRNTAYSEFATNHRMQFLIANGFDPKLMKKLAVGPVILREELIYRKEILMNEKIKLTCELCKASEDYKKFGFKQLFYKQNDRLAAEVFVDGLWLDLKLRKSTIPPSPLLEIIKKFPKGDNFQWI